MEEYVLAAEREFGRPEGSTFPDGCPESRKGVLNALEVPGFRAPDRHRPCPAATTKRFTDCDHRHRRGAHGAPDST